MQKRNAVLVRTLISLAIGAGLAACSSTEKDAADASTGSTAVVLSAPAAPLEEVVVSGSRVRQSTSAAAARIERQETARVAAYAPAPMYDFRGRPEANTENYASITDNGIKQAASEPVSTFSIDIDTGSYSNVRRFLQNGQLPPADAVRTEELINYFGYEYPDLAHDGPFSVITEIAPSPWHRGRHLLHVGIEAIEPDAAGELHSNLVFLVDVSGSMDSPDKLELLKTSLKLLARQLTADDSIAIVVYAGASGVVLEPTPGNDSRAITNALERLQAGGSTNGAAGIELAYGLAQEHFIDGGINRVLLATDGDFNVGITDFDQLKKLIERGEAE